jgi:hypothetical protein
MSQRRFEGLGELMEMGAAVFVRDEPSGPGRGKWPPFKVFKKVVNALSKARVRFLVEGGWAVAAYGFERMTRDIDLIVPVEPFLARQAYRALLKIGGVPVKGLTEDRAADLETWVMTFRVGGWNVDLIKEHDVEKLLARALPAKIERITIKVIDPMDLVKRKRQRNDPKDRLDIEFLLGLGRRYDSESSE